MIKLETRRYRCSEFREGAKFPALSMAREEPKFKSSIRDYEGLFINYGFRETAYPYTQQNDYTEEREREIPVAVLENELVYAEFLPTLGGRLWKLYDKKRSRSLLYTNDVIRFCNLSIRNAWFSGGVEWNCGLIGHTPFTCAPMYCAQVNGANGEEALRFYEFERVRGVYYQMDFWLEEDRLLAAVRIENPGDEVVPMYWWSNMATPEYEGGRVAVPARRAYNNSDGMGIRKSPIPVDHGVDVSFPGNIPDTIDYFYDIPEQEQKFIANVDASGQGLLQWSSHRLKGRKLFSWGHRRGSAHWQSLLTDKAGDYVEIQAGLGKTQYECLPMPPKTAWSFLECYALADVGAEAAAGPYETLVAAVNRQIDKIGNSDALERRLPGLINDISLQRAKLLCAGSGFGCLHAALGGCAPAHLEFVQDAESEYWLSLLENRALKPDVISYPCGAGMERLLLKRQTQCDWRISYQLALLAYDKRAFQSAKQYCEQSMVLDNNLHNNYLYAFVLYQLGHAHCLYFIRKCLRLASGAYGACESLLRLLLEMEEYAALIGLFPELDGKLQKNPRLRMYFALACFKSGNARQAEEILTEHGGLILRDYREGDRMLDTLYRGIRKERHHECDAEITVPEQFDFIVSK